MNTTINQELEIQTSGVPAKITDNYEALKNTLQERLKESDIVVTEDTVVAARKTAAEINALKKRISDARKQRVEEVSAPIEEFKVRMKDLETLCDNARLGITSQISKFDEKRLILARRLAVEYYNKMADGKDVPGQFRDSSLANDKVTISDLTAKGVLAASGKKKVDALVLEAHAMHTMVQEREAALGDASDAAGLRQALTIDDVRHIVLLPPDQYNAERAQIIERAVRREQAAQATEAAAAPEVETPAQKNSPEEPSAPEGLSAPPPMEDDQPDRVPTTITVVFKTVTPSLMLDAEIEAKTRKKMSEAGFKSLHSIHIARHPIQTGR